MDIHEVASSLMPPTKFQCLALPILLQRLNTWADGVPFGKGQLWFHLTGSIFCAEPPGLVCFIDISMQLSVALFACSHIGVSTGTEACCVIAAACMKCGFVARETVEATNLGS